MSEHTTQSDARGNEPRSGPYTRYTTPNPRGKHKMRDREMAIPPEGGSLSNHGRSEPDYKIEDCGYDTPCWVWLKYKNKAGYGLSRYWHIGEGCVNPEHMEPKPKGHHVREHKRATVALSDEQRAEIRELGRDPDLSQQDIADRFGIPRPTVNKILNGYSWFDGERVLPERECRGCGVTFQVTNRRQRYCTRDCQKGRGR